MKKFIVLALVLFILFIVAIGGLSILGMKQFEKVARQVLPTSPTVVEHLGTLEEVDFMLVETSKIEEDDTQVYDVVGSKGSGRITVKLAEAGETVQIVGGELRLADGTVHPLAPPEAQKSE